MIQHFSDHSANERTFLAWIRTAIAIIAFGFLVEKFDLFLEIAASSLNGRRLSIAGEKFGNEAGLAVIVLGMVIIVVAATRYFITAKNIDSPEVKFRPGSRFDLTLATLLVMLGAAMLLYLTHAFVTTVSG